MLQRIQIESFKSLSRLDLEPGQVNVLVGANGVGKSNVLEAIGVLGAAADGQVDDSTLLRRGVRPGLPATYKSSFRKQRISPQIGLSATQKQACYSVQLRNPIDDPQEAWAYFGESLDQDSKKVMERVPGPNGGMDRGLAALHLASLALDNPASILLRELQGYRVYTPDTHTLRGLVVDSQQQDPVGLSGGRLAEAVQATLKHLGEGAGEVHDTLSELLDWVDGFDVVPAAATPMSRSIPTTPFVLRFRDRYMSDSRNAVSGYDASEGALLVLFLMVLALHPNAPTLFAVDNVDHGLNPRLARRLIAEFTSWTLRNPRRQVFLTAHNPLVLDGLPLQDDRVRLFTVDRSQPSGHTVLHRIKLTPELLEKAKLGWTLSRMWVNSMLGGVPDV